MRLLFLILITLSASPLDDLLAGNYLVTWNVGQGQWLTHISNSHCRHFDMGGETFPWKTLRKACHGKTNLVYLSHWDWDHIGALSKTQRVRTNLPELCLKLRPRGKSSRYKERLLKRWPHCQNSMNLSPDDLRQWSPSTGKDSNSQSHVLRMGDILIPGDSPATEERTWRQLPWIRSARILILGHHGSRTSSSEALLTELPSLKLGIVSARWARYRHPHPQVLERFARRSIPLIRTEDWGNIWIEL